MYFDVKLQGLNNVSSQLGTYRFKLKKEQAELKILSKLIGLSNDSFNDLAKEIEEASELAEQYANELKALKKGLKNIVKGYRESEKKIVGYIECVKTEFDRDVFTEEEQSQYEAYVKEVDEIYNTLTAADGDYWKSLMLWKELLEKMNPLNPSECTLTKAEKEAILKAIKPLAGAIDSKYDELAADNPIINNWVNEHSDLLNSKEAAAFEKAVIELLSTNGLLENLLGFKYRNGSDSYYTVEDSIQHQWGFCDYIDEMGSTLGMNLDTEITTFAYDGQEFRIQLWKGLYGYDGAVGGEFGIYSRPGWEAKGNPYVEGSKGSEMILYDAVDEAYQLPVKQTTTYARDRGKTKTFVNDTSTYGDGTHYWNLNIRTEAGIDKSTISTKFEIDCSSKDYGFQQALYESLLSEPNVTVEQEGRTVIVTY